MNPKPLPDRRPRAAAPGNPRLPLLLALAGTLLVALAGFWWWQQSQTDPGRSMSQGTITSRATDGDSLKLDVSFRVGSAAYSARGVVDSDALTYQGGTVWVCYNPSDPGDGPTIRLPYDPWCNSR